MREIRRPDDDELCGFVTEHGEGWQALAVFGGLLGTYSEPGEAEQRVRNDGLASLAERWHLVDPNTGDEQIVCIQEASPTSVTLALDYYSMPGVPTMTIPRSRLDDGTHELRLR